MCGTYVCMLIKYSTNTSKLSLYDASGFKATRLERITITNRLFDKQPPTKPTKLHTITNYSNFNNYSDYPRLIYERHIFKLNEKRLLKVISRLKLWIYYIDVTMHAKYALIKFIGIALLNVSSMSKQSQ